MGFLDADDLYLAGGLSAMLAQALSTQSELVHAPFLHATGRYGLGGEARSWLNILDRTEFQHISSPATFAQVPSLQLIVAPWKFLHKVEYLRENSIEFDPALRKFEDRPFVLSNLLAGGVISFCKVPSRIWRARPGSISSSEKRNDEVELALQSVERCVQIVEESIEAGGVSRIYLARELAHSLHRVTVSTQILQLANAGFLDFRERLEAMFSKARSLEEFVDDKVIANRTTAMRQQLGFTKKDVLDLLASLMEGDFEATQHFERHIRK
ncbi:hypothetical protein N9V95_00555 [bacterium]|nr:hypothetical protein [bacterium]